MSRSTDIEHLGHCRQFLDAVRLVEACPARGHYSSADEIPNETIMSQNTVLSRFYWMSVMEYKFPNCQKEKEVPAPAPVRRAAA